MLKPLYLESTAENPKVVLDKEKGIFKIRKVDT